MRVFDIILILDDQYTLLDIQWYHPDMEKNYGPIWHQYIGQPLGDVFDIKLKKEFGELEWKDEKYSHNNLCFFLVNSLFLTFSFFIESFFSLCHSPWPKIMDIWIFGVHLIRRRLIFAMIGLSYPQLLTAA